jgi:hypothetical protein
MVPIIRAPAASAVVIASSPSGLSKPSPLLSAPLAASARSVAVGGGDGDRLLGGGTVAEVAVSGGGSSRIVITGAEALLGLSLDRVNATGAPAGSEAASAAVAASNWSIVWRRTWPTRGERGGGGDGTGDGRRIGSGCGC